MSKELIEKLREERDSFQRVGISAAEQATKGTEMLAAAYVERDTLRQQCDKLAGLLDEVTDDFVVNYLDADLIKRIDAALAELK